MDGSLSPELLESVASEESGFKPTEAQASKRRKVITVKVGENGGKLKNKGPPSDLWSWRKYGPKPIKGSPYPRGYYRCSTSKGCSAKKQVEICKTDASMLTITYTSSHNHPGPNLDSTHMKQYWPKEPQSSHTDDDEPPTPEQEQVPEVSKVQNEGSKSSSDEEASEDHNFHYLQSPLNVNISQEDYLMGNLGRTRDSLEFLLDEEPLCFPHITTSLTPKSKENNFFDELEELYAYLRLSQVS